MIKIKEFYDGNPLFILKDPMGETSLANSYLIFRLIKTSRRITFDILYQAPEVRWTGEDDGDFPTFIASNGYHIITRSQMDIQTERIWLLGAATENIRSGSMVFSTNDKLERAYPQFLVALHEWRDHVNELKVQGIKWVNNS